MSSRELLSSRLCSWIVAAAGLASAGSVAHAQWIYQRSIGTSANNEIGYDVSISNFDLLPQGVCTAGSVAQSPTAPSDFYLGRFRSDGGTTWTRRVFSTNEARDVAYSIEQLPDQGFIVAGETLPNTTPGSVFAAQIVLMRLNSLGNTVWAFRYGGTAFVDFPAGVSMRLTSDTTGNLAGAVVVGRRTDVPNNPIAGVMTHVNLGGAQIFQNAYISNPFAGNPFGILSFNDVRQYRDGGFVVVGWIDDRQFGGAIHPVVLRTDPLGNPIWFKQYPIGRETYGDGIAIDEASGEIVFSCREVSAAGFPTALVVARIDPAGNLLWLSGTGNFVDGFAAIEVTHNKKILVGGTTTNLNFGTTDAAMAKFDGGGALQWQAAYGQNGTNDLGHGVASFDCGRGHVLVGSNTFTAPPNNGLIDQYLVRTLVNGRSGCLDQPFAFPNPVPVAEPIDRPILRLPRNEQITWAHGNQFLISGNIAHCLNPTCVADVDDGSGTGKPDGGVGIEDLLAYLTLFEAGSPCADVDDGSGLGLPDGGVGIEDLLYYLTRFESGC